VSCRSPNACTAVGSFVSGNGLLMTVAEHWDGTSWGIQAMPSPAGAASATARGVSCILANACTAVGDYSAGSSTPLTLAETTF